MSRGEPQPDCADVAFGSSHAVSDPAEVALEDYAQAVTRARAAEAIRGEDGSVTRVHLCGLPAPPTPAASADIEAFARGLEDPHANGLGWG